MAKLAYLVIHCTATVAGKEVSSSDIKKWHTSPIPAGRGWKQVGYTDMIHLDGKIGRLVDNYDDANVDSWEVTNGAIGYNSSSRHIVYVGGLSKDWIKAEDTRTAAQLLAMENYVKIFKKRFPNVKIIGHNEIAQKACPSFDVQAWLKSIGV